MLIIFQKMKRKYQYLPLPYILLICTNYFSYQQIQVEKAFVLLLNKKGEDKKKYPFTYESRLTNQAEAKYAPTEL